MNPASELPFGKMLSPIGAGVDGFISHRHLGGTDRARRGAGIALVGTAVVECVASKGFGHRVFAVHHVGAHAPSNQAMKKPSSA